MQQRLFRRALREPGVLRVSVVAGLERKLRERRNVLGGAPRLDLLGGVPGLDLENVGVALGQLAEGLRFELLQKKGEDVRSTNG